MDSNNSDKSVGTFWNFTVNVLFRKPRVKYSSTEAQLNKLINRNVNTKLVNRNAFKMTQYITISYSYEQHVNLQTSLVNPPRTSFAQARANHEGIFITRMADSALSTLALLNFWIIPERIVVAVAVAIASSWAFGHFVFGLWEVPALFELLKILLLKVQNWQTVEEKISFNVLHIFCCHLFFDVKNYNMSV